MPKAMARAKRRARIVGVHIRGHNQAEDRSVSDSGKKTAAKTAMVPQKHGGALLPGGVPGNKGGGRPSNELRGSMREILEKGLPHLEEFVTGENDARPTDQLKAIEIAGRFGLPKEGLRQALR